jgi:hypothetical protein
MLLCGHTLCTAAGKGLYRFRNGDVYKGDFQDNHMTGQGVMDYNNGDRWVVGQSCPMVHVSSGGIGECVNVAQIQTGNR